MISVVEPGEGIHVERNLIYENSHEIKAEEKKIIYHKLNSRWFNVPTCILKYKHWSILFIRP